MCTVDLIVIIFQTTINANAFSEFLIGLIIYNKVNLTAINLKMC